MWFHILLFAVFAVAQALAAGTEFESDITVKASQGKRMTRSRSHVLANLGTSEYLTSPRSRALGYPGKSEQLWLGCFAVLLLVIVGTVIRREPTKEQQDLENDRLASNGGRQVSEGFRLKSVIGAVVALQVILYVVSCWMVTPLAPPGEFKPTGGAMFKIGSSNGAAEMCGIRDQFPYHLIELRRWIVPIFLHVSPIHIIMNCYFECSSGVRIEALMGPLSFAMLFFGAGLTGNLLSDSFGVNGVGGSTACYGIIGMELALIYQAWPRMGEEQKESTKHHLVLTCALLILWELMLWKEIDHFGHLGGFIGGFLIFLGQTDRRAIAAFAVMTAACIWAICIHPLFEDQFNGQPWQAFCNSIWASYTV